MLVSYAIIGFDDIEFFSKLFEVAKNAVNGLDFFATLALSCSIVSNGDGSGLSLQWTHCFPSLFNTIFPSSSLGNSTLLSFAKAYISGVSGFLGFASTIGSFPYLVAIALSIAIPALSTSEISKS